MLITRYLPGPVKRKSNKIMSLSIVFGGDHDLVFFFSIFSPTQVRPSGPSEENELDPPKSPAGSGRVCGRRGGLQPPGAVSGSHTGGGTQSRLLSPAARPGWRARGLAVPDPEGARGPSDRQSRLHSLAAGEATLYLYIERKNCYREACLK